MKSIYKISLMLVLWKQAVQMTDCLLRWKNKISALILCSHLACGYGDVQMEEPVPGKHHKTIAKGERRNFSSFILAMHSQASLSCWVVGGSMTVFSSEGTWYHFLPNSNGTWSLSFNSKALQKPRSLILKQEPMHYFCLQTSLK